MKEAVNEAIQVQENNNNTNIAVATDSLHGIQYSKVGRLPTIQSAKLLLSYTVMYFVKSLNKSSISYLVYTRSKSFISTYLKF